MSTERIGGTGERAGEAGRSWGTVPSVRDATRDVAGRGGTGLDSDKDVAGRVGRMPGTFAGVAVVGGPSGVTAARTTRGPAAGVWTGAFCGLMRPATFVIVLSDKGFIWKSSGRFVHAGLDTGTTGRTGRLRGVGINGVRDFFWDGVSIPGSVIEKKPAARSWAPRPAVPTPTLAPSTSILPSTVMVRVLLRALHERTRCFT